MVLQKIDLVKELTRARLRDKRSAHAFQEVQELLQNDNHSKSIKNTLETCGTGVPNAFYFDFLETQYIYHIDQIRKVCIDYRLRFLDSKYFKGQIPAEAISKIKALEELHQIAIQNFKIVAPSKLFRLYNSDDPLLFAPIGNEYYYLIHKWGNDLHPLRKLAMWPFRNVKNLALLLVGISFLLTMVVPEGLFSKKITAGEFWVVFFFVFKSVVAVAIFYGFALGKNFNPAIWNSKYFNS